MTVRTLGKNFKNLVINGSVTPVTLIAPGDNPNGSIVRSLAVNGTAVISATTPVSGRDSYVKYLIVPTSRTQYDDLMIPAGSGLFVYNANEFSNAIVMSWDVLNADGTVA